VASKPALSNAGLGATIDALAYDEHGEARPGQIAAERALTIYLDKREIITIMTLGTQPELLVLGWLKNQNLLHSLTAVSSIQVDWDVEAAAVTTSQVTADIEETLSRRTVTTGCGQGTLFGNILESLQEHKLQPPVVKRSMLYALLRNLAAHNEVYRKAGAVHGCALCAGTEIVRFVEDVGRHNAVDAIAGYTWLNGIGGEDKWFYTTGRLTSEMVLKVAQMGVPVLLSRSGVTQKGLELAQQLNMVLIARAKGKHFLVYNGIEHLQLDDADV